MESAKKKMERYGPLTRGLNGYVESVRVAKVVEAREDAARVKRAQRVHHLSAKERAHDLDGEEILRARRNPL